MSCVQGHASNPSFSYCNLNYHPVDNVFGGMGEQVEFLQQIKGCRVLWGPSCSNWFPHPSMAQMARIAHSYPHLFPTNIGVCQKWKNSECSLWGLSRNSISCVLLTSLMGYLPSIRPCEEVPFGGKPKVVTVIPPGWSLCGSGKLCPSTPQWEQGLRVEGSVPDHRIYQAFFLWVGAGTEGRC